MAIARAIAGRAAGEPTLATDLSAADYRAAFGNRE
jgi:hypothetical protein